MPQSHALPPSPPRERNFVCRPRAWTRGQFAESSQHNSPNGLHATFHLCRVTTGSVLVPYHPFKSQTWACTQSGQTRTRHASKGKKSKTKQVGLFSWGSPGTPDWAAVCVGGFRRIPAIGGLKKHRWIFQHEVFENISEKKTLAVSPP
jgi:hypothetical protein